MSLIDQLKWLGKEDEILFQKHKFRGKLAGKAWKYTQNFNGLIRTRAIIFIMSILVLYPILSNYLFHDFFSLELIVERLIYAGILFIAGLLFNKIRLISIIISVMVILLILTGYFISGQYGLKIIGFMGAILFFMLLGIYHHFNLKRLRKELEANLLENQLVE